MRERSECDESGAAGHLQLRMGPTKRRDAEQECLRPLRLSV